MARRLDSKDTKLAGWSGAFALALGLYVYVTDQLDVKQPPAVSMLLLLAAVAMGGVSAWKILGAVVLPGWPVRIARMVLVPGLVALSLYPVVYRPVETDAVRPDVTLHFVKPTEPAVWLRNDSEAVAENIKWQFELFNLDNPSSVDGTVYRFVPIPNRSFDFLRPHRRSGTHAVFEAPVAAATVRAGNRLFGSVTVSCPTCVRDRVYWVFLTLGQGGWYSELPAGHSVDMKEYVRALPLLMKSQNPERDLRGWIPEERRTAIPTRIED